MSIFKRKRQIDDKTFVPVEVGVNDSVPIGSVTKETLMTAAKDAGKDVTSHMKKEELYDIVFGGND